jgi:uroporphyrin-III C-methyltransferase/precorrin-2 dehydrogenase/sirohydrochlorin ferrochelatase
MSTSRKPLEMTPPRLGVLARLPVFFALADKRAVLVGEGQGVTWKLELLQAAGARVQVYAANQWTVDDLRGAAIAVGAFDSDDEAQRFCDAARAAGVPVNVIDKPAFCDFSFGAIVNRSPLVIGISTDGAAPVFAQAIRAKLEALLPKGFADWAAAAARWRGALKGSGLSFAGRRKFWRLFTAHAVANPDRLPVDADFSRFVADVSGEGTAVENGSVTLVGAGPGDPELLTLRAVRALQSADVILFDDLVSREVLDFARREAKKMLVGKTGFGPSCKQDDINALMVSLAKQGKRVVRLKGGDPLIFARAGEEIDACRAAGIVVDVVPGITAAQGAAARLCLPLTDRTQARRLQYITGHAKDGGVPADVDWASLADPATTTAIYMPTRTLAALAEGAVAKGLDPRTPALAIACATRPDQGVVAGAIEDLPALLAKADLPGPLLVVIGRTVGAYCQRGLPALAASPARTPSLIFSPVKVTAPSGGTKMG